MMTDSEFASKMDGLYKSLYNFSWKMLGNREDAEDAVQQGMLNGWRARRKYDGRSISSWMYAIVGNVSKDRLRKKKVGNGLDELEPSLDSGMQGPYDIVSGVDQLNSWRSNIEATLDSMRGDQSDLLRRKYIDGMTFEAISEDLGIPKGTAQTRSLAAKKEFESTYKRMFGEPFLGSLN